MGSVPRRIDSTCKGTVLVLGVLGGSVWSETVSVGE